MTDSKLRVALAHDSFTQQGGAEKVLDVLHGMFPDAPVSTLVIDRKLSGVYTGWDIRTSWLQVFFNVFPKLQYYLFCIPLAVRSLRFDGYDVVVSSSSTFIKNICVPKGTRHICYCHTPTRFLWSDAEYVNQETPWVIRPVVKRFLSWMKRWDYRAAQKVDVFIANSKEVQKRIKKYYNRESTVIYPGIDTGFWHPTSGKKDYFLIAGRLHAHKHNELIVEIFNELGLPLHIVGAGRQKEYLQSIAKTNITFFGRVSDEVLRDEYSGAKAFLYPQLEDFGLMPLEAAACGTATIALGQGGSLETVAPGVTGELFGQDVVQGIALPQSLGERRGLPLTQAPYREEIKKIIVNWHPEKYPPAHLRAHAERFSVEKFKRQVLECIYENNH